MITIAANLPIHRICWLFYNSTMSRAIFFTRNEKLAMLKIMIDISNHYKERLPLAFQIIQRKSVALLGSLNGVSEAEFMLLTEVLGVVNNFKHDENKIDFIKALLAEMLQTSHFGSFTKYENSNYDDDSELMETFRSEWSYIYQLLKEIIFVADKNNSFTITLISWRYVRKHFKTWTMLEKQGSTECQDEIHTAF